MKKTTSILLGMMCLATVGFADAKLDAYKQEANEQIAKIMNSDKSLDKKASILAEKAQKLILKDKLDARQKVMLKEYYVKLGDLNLDTLHNYDKAMEYYGKAVVLKDDGQTQMKKGNACFYSQRYEEALAAYRSALKQGDLAEKDMPDFYFMKGQAEYWDGDYGSAELDLKKAFELNKDKKEQIARELVTCLWERGSYDEALAWLKDYAKLSKEKDFVYRNQAGINYEIGEYGEGAKALAALEKQYPNDEALLLLKAELKYAQGQYQEAKELMMQEYAKKNRKNTYDYYCNLLLAQLALKDGQKNGNYEPAELYLERAVRKPMPAYGIKVKADIYLAMGYKQKALEHYIAFLKTSTSATVNQQVAVQTAKLQNEIWPTGVPADKQ